MNGMQFLNYFKKNFLYKINVRYTTNSKLMISRIHPLSRLSNFELLRIFSMLLILIHHFICHGMNSKLAPPRFDYNC